MKEKDKSVYIKRTQKDYSLSLKLQIVREIEQGQLSTTQAQKKYGIQSYSTVLNWLRKYGNFDWENQNPSKTPSPNNAKSYFVGSFWSSFLKLLSNSFKALASFCFRAINPNFRAILPE